MKQLHVLLVPLVLITSSYVFSVFVCVCVCVCVCGCVHSCQQRVRSADGVNSDANSLASGASINERVHIHTLYTHIHTQHTHIHTLYTHIHTHFTHTYTHKRTRTHTNIRTYIHGEPILSCDFQFSSMQGLGV